MPTPVRVQDIFYRYSVDWLKNAYTFMPSFGATETVPSNAWTMLGRDESRRSQPSLMWFLFRNKFGTLIQEYHNDSLMLLC
jgi:hypothetical protein